MVIILELCKQVLSILYNLRGNKNKMIQRINLKYHISSVLCSGKTISNGKTKTTTQFFMTFKLFLYYATIVCGTSPLSLLTFFQINKMNKQAPVLKNIFYCCKTLRIQIVEPSILKSHLAAILWQTILMG